MDNFLDESSTAQYQFVLGDEKFPLNPLVGKKISLKWLGTIHCLDTGESIKKSYGQGYSYKAFMRLAQCDLCYVKPELCHYHKGTCRQPEWGEAHCFRPHIVYLSLTSAAKVGITRATNVPHRWIDQGAIKALPILEVASRFDSGVIEVEMAKMVGDKTQYKKMLLGEVEDCDLFQLREELFESCADLLDSLDAKDLDEEIITINYPILEPPKKITTLDFHKQALIEGTLLGIKGQYLILDCGVINLRKFQGYTVEINN